jgi:hypothetical protein
MATERAKLIVTVFAVMFALGLLATPTGAIDTPNERITLVGLTGVHVVFDELGEAAERRGLTRASLQAEVDRRLRQAGLRVLTPTQAQASVGRPTLHLRVGLLQTPDVADVYVYSVDLSLRQQVRLVRDRTLESYAVTWSEHRAVGAVRTARLGMVRDTLLQKVDEFVTAWRTSNQD